MFDLSPINKRSGKNTCFKTDEMNLFVPKSDQLLSSTANDRLLKRTVILNRFLIHVLTLNRFFFGRIAFFSFVFD